MNQTSTTTITTASTHGQTDATSPANVPAVDVIDLRSVDSRPMSIRVEPELPAGVPVVFATTADGLRVLAVNPAVPQLELRMAAVAAIDAADEREEGAVGAFAPRMGQVGHQVLDLTAINRRGLDVWITSDPTLPSGVPATLTPDDDGRHVLRTNPDEPWHRVETTANDLIYRAATVFAPVGGPGCPPWCGQHFEAPDTALLHERLIGTVPTLDGDDLKVTLTQTGEEAAQVEVLGGDDALDAAGARRLGALLVAASTTLEPADDLRLTTATGTAAADLPNGMWMDVHRTLNHHGLNAPAVEVMLAVKHLIDVTSTADGGRKA